MASAYKGITIKELYELLGEYRVLYIVDTSFLISALISMLKGEHNSYEIRLVGKAKHSLFVVPQLVIEEILKLSRLPRKIAKLLSIDETEAKKIIRDKLDLTLRHTMQHKNFYILQTQSIAGEIEEVAKTLKLAFRAKPAYISPKDADIAAIALIAERLSPNTTVIVLTENPRDFYGLTQLNIKIFCSIIEEKILGIVHIRD